MMDIIGHAKKLERRIARSLDAAVGELVSAAPAEPLEILHVMLDRAEQEIQHTGRGRRTFPYTRVRLLVAIPAKDTRGRARFDAVVQGPPTLHERLRSRLEAAGVAGAAPAVDVEYVAKAGSGWTDARFEVELLREAAPPPVVAPSTTPELKLTITAGKASHRSYSFTGGRIDMGRRAQVLDTRQRVIRTNHVAFAEEGPDENSTVSRRHAHIAYDASTRSYRLADDRSAHGTAIVRKGKTVTVHAGPRGVRLEHGDEILLGQARIRVGLT